MESHIVKRIILNKEDCIWFEKTYPNGSYTWLLNMLLSEFRASHKITPQDIAAIAAQEVIKKWK